MFTPTKNKIKTIVRGKFNIFGIKQIFFNIHFYQLKIYYIMSKITILIPCYNDWSCLNELIPQIDKSLEEIKKDANVIIVNDCSTIKHTLNGINCKNITLKILNLRKM